MNSQGKSKKILDLEKGLPLTQDDIRAMRQCPSLQDNSDLAAYLDFLEEVGAFETKKTDVKIYSKTFKL